MDQQTEATERGLALEAGHEIVGQGHAFERRAQHELTRMQDEGLVRLRLDQLREIGLLLLHVDVGVAGVREDPELRVDVQVDR